MSVCCVCGEAGDLPILLLSHLLVLLSSHSYPDQWTTLIHSVSCAIGASLGTNGAVNINCKKYSVIRGFKWFGLLGSYFDLSGYHPILNVLSFPLLLQCRRSGIDPWVGKIPWSKEWPSTPVFLPGEFHGQRGAWRAAVDGVTKSQAWLSD